MTRDEARAYFSESGLSYADVTLEDLYYLQLLLDMQIFQERKRRFQTRHKPQYWICVNNAKYFKGEYTPEGRLIRAYMTGKGRYFTAREVISFNRGGYIGFCGDADNENKEPILVAFIEWCDWMVERKEKRQNAEM